MICMSRWRKACGLRSAINLIIRKPSHRNGRKLLSLISTVFLCFIESLIITGVSDPCAHSYSSTIGKNYALNGWKTVCMVQCPSLYPKHDIPQQSKTNLSLLRKAGRYLLLGDFFFCQRVRHLILCDLISVNHLLVIIIGFLDGADD